MCCLHHTAWSADTLRVVSAKVLGHEREDGSLALVEESHVVGFLACGDGLVVLVVVIHQLLFDLFVVLHRDAWLEFAIGTESLVKPEGSAFRQFSVLWWNVDVVPDAFLVPTEMHAESLRVGRGGKEVLHR